MKIGLRVNKDDNGKFVNVDNAFLELGIGGGQIASTITTHEPSMSNHHSNFILEGNEMIQIKPTITAQNQELYRIENQYRIRKLTPLECFRLMGVDDTDAKKMLEVNSNSQCYKQAGNSIVVDVMAAMFEKLF